MQHQRAQQLFLLTVCSSPQEHFILTPPTQSTTEAAPYSQLFHTCTLQKKRTSFSHKCVSEGQTLKLTQSSDCEDETDNLTVWQPDNVLWVRHWPTKHPGKWQSYVFHSRLHDYVIAISKLDAVWLTWGEAVFWGKFIIVSVKRSDSRRDFSSTQTLVELKLFASDRHCFWAERWWRVRRTDGRADRRMSCKLPKTLTVTTLLLQNFTPRRLLDIHTEVENWRRILAYKWQCDLGYWLIPTDFCNLWLLNLSMLMLTDTIS